MSVQSKLSGIVEILRALRRQPDETAGVLRRVPYEVRGMEYGARWQPNGDVLGPPDSDNPLRQFFDAHTEGHGLWKWLHYFSVYHRHFQKFIGQPITMLEIGIYSGGSLEMWREYFGPQAVIYGVDIEPACKSYERENTHVLIGDQSDRTFWAKVRRECPHFDIVIDDGSHIGEHQIISFEELMPHVKPGGVYLCEDLSSERSEFVAFVHGLARRFNAANDFTSKDGGHATPLPLQRAIGSIHLYPWVVAVERTDREPERFISPRKGTQWQPFYSHIEF